MARLAAMWLCLGHRYPEWQARRLAEGRVSGPLAFGMLYANPVFDGQGFLDWFHPRNRRERIRLYAVGAVFLALGFLVFLGLFVLVNGL
ncbi:hypothetical protein JWJ88_14225 [Paracoccus methylovorus]|uniref:DUF3592 domain-containing protein n=1 Tax=Paracoccus methylovorus TaxID=2812658 RepID=A0ABX7JNE7_9RHOB|nr:MULTISPECIES: hypothetical protein [Paracoccus]QRZ15501.1 hypothetical protein JWJ88_14225 [Paracoccus methylovorus]